MRPTLPLLLLAAVAAGCATTPPDQDPVQIKLNDLDTRLARTERIAANDVQVAQPRSYKFVPACPKSVASSATMRWISW